MRCSLVSNKIIQARERLGLTQQQLAEKLCVTNKAVSKWECGVTLPDISLLVPLCRVLGLTVQELLDEYDRNDGIHIVRNRSGITAENLSNILKRNDIKKSDAYQSGFLEGTTPAYEAYMRLKKSLAASIE